MQALLFAVLRPGESVDSDLLSVQCALSRSIPRCQEDCLAAASPSLAASWSLAAYIPRSGTLCPRGTVLVIRQPTTKAYCAPFMYSNYMLKTTLNDEPMKFPNPQQTRIDPYATGFITLATSTLNHLDHKRPIRGGTVIEEFVLHIDIVVGFLTAARPIPCV